MKKCLLAVAAALGVVTSASAADLGARGYNNAPAYAAPIYAWTGFYLGAHVGGAFSYSGSNNFNGLVLSDYDARLLGGVQAGADWQFAGNFVVGAEGQYSWTGKNNLNAVFPAGFVYNNNQRALASITARFGYAFGAALVYVKGGYAWSDNSETLTFARRADRIRARLQPQQWLDRRRRRRISVRAKLVGQGRVPILQFRRQPLPGARRAGSVRNLSQRRTHPQARRELPLQLRKPGRRALLSRTTLINIF